MDALLEGLEDILAEEIELYRRLVELSRHKTDVLVAGDVEALDKIVREEQGLILHGSSLEKDLNKCIQELAGKMEFSGCSTLSQLLQKVTGEHQQRLASIGEELGSLLKEQKEVNGLNGWLIQSNLDYVNHVLSRIQGSNSIYSMEGTRVNRDMTVSLMDRKI